jgi:hypothetical protein
MHAISCAADPNRGAWKNTSLRLVVASFPLSAPHDLVAASPSFDWESVLRRRRVGNGRAAMRLLCSTTSLMINCLAFSSLLFTQSCCNMSVTFTYVKIFLMITAMHHVELRN